MRRLSLSLLLAFGLTACVAPYDPPAVQPDSIAIPGLKSEAANSPIVLWVHGMCTHTNSDGFVPDRVKTIASGLDLALAGSADSGEVTSKSFDIGPPNTIDGKRAYVVQNTIRLPQASTTFNMDFLMWSPLTTPFKTALRQETPDKLDDAAGPFPVTRAVFNRQLKFGLMDDCLSDAIIYVGANGAPLRLATEAILCRELGGDLNASGTCDLPEQINSRPIFLVSESLGSKILLDAVRSVVNASSGTKRDNLENHLAEIRALFMLANQVPILDQADVEHNGEHNGALDDLVNFIGNAKSNTLARHKELSPEARQRLSTLSVVAFADPNDLLSYRLVPRSLSFSNNVTAQLSNVLVSNAETLLLPKAWILPGSVELPDAAHCGYSWNPYVMGIIVQGYSVGAAPPQSPAVANSSCISDPTTNAPPPG